MRTFLLCLWRVVERNWGGPSMGDFAQNLSALPVHGAMPYQIARGKRNWSCCSKSEYPARPWGDALPIRKCSYCSSLICLPIHGQIFEEVIFVAIFCRGQDMRSGSGVVHQRCGISLLAMQSIGAGTFRCGVGFRGHLLCVVPIVLGCGCAHRYESLCALPFASCFE